MLKRQSDFRHYDFEQNNTITEDCCGNTCTLFLARDFLTTARPTSYQITWVEANCLCSIEGLYLGWFNQLPSK